MISGHIQLEDYSTVIEIFAHLHGRHLAHRGRCTQGRNHWLPAAFSSSCGSGHVLKKDLRIATLRIPSEYQTIRLSLVRALPRT